MCKITWELTFFRRKFDKLKFDPYLTPYLKLWVEGNSIALWGPENHNFWSKTQQNWLFSGENWTNWNWTLIWPLIWHLILPFYANFVAEGNSRASWEPENCIPWTKIHGYCFFLGLHRQNDNWPLIWPLILSFLAKVKPIS